MGVDAKLLVNAKYTAKDIRELLVACGYIINRVENKDDHSFIHFTDKNELSDNKNRMMYCGRTSEYGGLDGVILTLSQWGNATHILKRIASVIGGFLCESDTTDDYEMFQDPHNGFSRFVLDHQIITNALTQKDADELCSKVAKATGYERG